MPGKRELKRAELTSRLLAAARDLISSQGLGGLRARDVTSRAVCGLGTIYKCYADLDDLIIHVNSQTLARLREALADVLEASDDPVRQLRGLAFAYHAFAKTNTNLWLALFEHHLPEGVETPKWHIIENTALLDLIARPVSKLEPGLEAEDLQARTRTFFAAVHGVVLISLQGRFVSLSGQVLHEELGLLVDRLAQARGSGS